MRSLSYLFVLIASFTLFSFQCKKAQLAIHPYIRPAPTLPPHWGSSQPGQLGALERAFLLGDKKRLEKAKLKIYKELNLLHLFTPSGLHFYPFAQLFSFFLNPHWLTPLYFLIFILLQWLPGFWALKRILLLKSLYEFFQCTPFRFHYSQVFFLAFSIDFLWGTYREMPLSFCYSFLFLGSLVCCQNKREVYFALIIAQLLSLAIFQKPVYFFSLLLNLPLSLLFSSIFPLLFFNFWLPIFSFQQSLNQYFILAFDTLVQWIYQTTTLPPPIWVSPLFVFSFILVFNLRSNFLVLALCLYPNTIQEISLHLFKHKTLYKYISI
ncbi:MAG: hypothetical protein H6621_05305 [Halobacteriovoraceae bacterium]|nr:hypothetical protein [Halobacteriovoraceae bacterium]